MQRCCWRSKRISIFLVVFLGYAYFKMIGDTFMLVNIGLISFSAVTQLAPSLLGAIYWKRGNTAGATAGIIGGFSIWFYTLLLPSFVKSGWIDSDMLEKGLFGIALLKPTELFGLTGLGHVEQHPLLEHAFQYRRLPLSSRYFLNRMKWRREQCRKFTEPFSADALSTDLGGDKTTFKTGHHH